MALVLSLTLLVIGVMNIVMGILIVAGVGGNKKANIYFMLVCMATALWCLGYSIMGMSSSPVSGYLMRAMALIGVTTCCPLVITYVRILSGITMSRQKLFDAFMWMCGIICYVLVAIPYSVSFVNTSYGMYYVSRPWVGRYIQYIYLGVLFISWVYIGLKWYSITNRKMEKRMAVTVIRSAVVMIVGIFFDTILPIFGSAAFPGSAIATIFSVYILFSSLRFHNNSSLKGTQVAEDIFDLVKSPVVLLDAQLNVVKCNDRACEYLGGTREDILSKRITVWVQNFSEDERERIQAEFANRASSFSFVSRVRKTGAKCSIDSSAIYDKFGDVVGLICIMNDMTSVEDMQEQIDTSRHNAYLANATKQSFLRNIDINIISPLRDIISGCAQIQDELHGMKDVSDRHRGVMRRLSDMESESTQLLGTIGDMLDISQMESGTFVIEKFKYDLEALLSEVITDIDAKLRKKNILFVTHISPSVPRTLIGDKRRLKQVLMNILDNAAKFTDRGIVSLSLKYRIRYGKVTLMFDISDTGRGLREEEMDLIFGPASSDGGYDRENMGSGLGLNICRNIVRLMNGEMTVKSAYGQGSVFSFTVEQKSDSEVSLVPYGDYHDKVMIIEEIPEYADAIEQLVREVGLECQTIIPKTAEEIVVTDASDYTLILVSAGAYGRYRKILDSTYTYARIVPLYSIENYKMLMDGEVGICGPLIFAQIKDFIK